MPHQTLTLIGVTLFCVTVGGYVGWQAKIVREQRALTTHNDDVYMCEFYQPSDAPASTSVPWLRRQLGDHGFLKIELETRVPDSTLERYRAAFPEADVHRVTAKRVTFWDRLRQRFTYSAGLRPSSVTQP